MTDKNISIWKVEEFLIDNLKELPMGNGKFKIKAECSLQEFLDKLEKYVKDKDAVDFFSVHSKDEVDEIDRRIEKKQKEYDAELRDRMMKTKDFPMTD